MSQNDYRLYIDECIQLAETLNIKSESTASSINDYMLIKYGPLSFDPDNPRTWKYYLNACGEYHATDPVLKIKSLDTQVEIDFTKANLSIHTETKKAYQYGSRYYTDLLLKYPEHEAIIHGVLYPAEMNKVIDQPNGTIMSYAPFLVEENEYSLIEEINEWLVGFHHRWYNKQFNISDSWYSAAVLGLMYTQLVSLILVLRLRKCMSSEAHSFHVKQYLKSHGWLDEYLPYMTRKQALFFYRNIRYIERNAGKTDTFHWLVEKVMTDRNLPLAEWNMHHNTDQLLVSLVNQTRFESNRLNSAASSTAAYASTAEILKKEINDAPLNPEYIRDHKERIDHLFSQSLSNQLKTKLLESSLVDYSDSTPFTLEDVYINQWVEYINTGRLSHLHIRFQTKSGSETILNLKDAYLYFFYAFAASRGVKMEFIPQTFARMVSREPKPDKADLLRIVNSEVVTDEDIDFLLSLHEPTGPLNTIDDFRDDGIKKHKSLIKELYFSYSQEAITRKAMIYALMLRLYKDQWYPSFYPGRSYLEWMDSLNLEYKNYTPDDWEKIYKNIYTALTGKELGSSRELAKVQKAMISILKKLSSYSIQFVAESNSDAVKQPHWSTLRVELDKSSSKSLRQILLGIFKIFKIDTYSKDYKRIDLDPLFAGFRIKPFKQPSKLIEVPIGIQLAKGAQKKVINLGIFRVNLVNLPLARDEEDWINHPNFKGYKDLSDEDKQKVKNIYCECPGSIHYPKQVDIEDIVDNNLIPGFEYLKPEMNYLNLFTYYWLPHEFKYGNQFKDRIYEIPPYSPFWGDDWLRHFKLFTGEDKVKAFKLDASAQNSTLIGFKYSGGFDDVSHFNSYKKGDKIVDIGSFDYYFNSIEGSTFNMRFSRETLSEFKFTGKNYNLNFNALIANVNMSFNYRLDHYKDSLRFGIKHLKYETGYTLSASAVKDMAIKYLPGQYENTPIAIKDSKDYSLSSYQPEFSSHALKSYSLGSRYEADMSALLKSYELPGIDIDSNGRVNWQ